MSRHPNDPRNRHGRPRRSPPTIDLKATEVKASGDVKTSKETGPTEQPLDAALAGAEPATPPRAEQAGPRPDDGGTTPPQGDVQGDVVAATPGDPAPPAAAAPAPDMAVTSPATEGAAPAGTSAGAEVPTPRARRARVWSSEAPSAAEANAATPGSSEPITLGSGADGTAPSSGDAPLSGSTAEAPLTGTAAPVPPPAEPRRAGIGALLGAGLLGGLIGAGGALLGSTALNRGPDLRQIEGRVATRDAVTALERKVAGLEQAQGGLADQARNAAREAAQAALRGAPSGASPAAPEAGQALAQAQSALAGLAQRVDAAEAEARTRTGAADQALAALRAQLAEQGQRSAEAVNALGARVSALDGVIPRLNAIETELKAQAGARAETNAAYDRRFTAQDQRLATQDGRLAAQDQRLAELAKQVAETGPEAVRGGLRVVLSDHLVQVLREGRPYPDTLAALRRLNVDAGALAPLEPFAAGGAPTLAALQTEFKPLADRIIASSRPANAQGDSFRDRLLRMADQVVSVRSVGDPGSGDLPGLVARIEAALERDAAPDAAAAWDALPEAARKVSEDWGRRLKARAAAEGAARQVSARALAGLEAPAR